MRRFLTVLSLGILSMVLGESFCLLDSTYIRVTKDGSCTWGTYRVETNGVDTLEYRAEDPGKAEGTIPFWVDHETRKKVCTIVVPNNVPLQWRFLNGMCQCSTAHTGDNLIYNFVVENLKPFDSEPDMADIEVVAPKLEIAMAFHEPVVSKPDGNKLTINAKDILDESGNFFGSMELSAEGRYAEFLSGLFMNNPKTEWKLIFEQFMLRVSPKAKLIGLDYGKDPRSAHGGPVKISIKYSIPEYAVVGDSELSFKPVSLNNFIPELFSFVRIGTSLKERKYKFQDECNHDIHISEHVNVPKGYLLSTGSQKGISDGRVASFKGGVSQSYAGLDINEEISLKKTIYEPEEWPEFKKAVEGFKKYSDWITIVK